MGVVNRLLLFFSAVFFGAVSIGVILLVLHAVPERVLSNEYQYAVAQWQTGVIAGVVFLISIHLLFCSFSGREKKETASGDIILIHGESGDVTVSLGAVRSMVERISSNVRGVREAKVKSTLEHNSENGDCLRLNIKLQVGQDRSVAAISDDIRANAGQYLTDVACISNFDLGVTVQEIVSGVVVKKRRLK